MITQSEELAPEEIVVTKLRTDISIFPLATGETSSDLTGGTRESVTPKKCIKKNKK